MLSFTDGVQRAQGSADAVIRQFDQLQITRMSGPRRTRIVTSGAAPSAHFALYCITGAPLVQTAQCSFPLEAGEVGMLGSAEDAVIVLPAGSDLLLIRILDSTAGAFATVLRAAHGQRWSTVTGTPSLVGHLLDAIAAQAADYLPADPARLAQHIVGLISLMCSDSVRPPSSGRASLLQSSKEYIEAHLGDLELTPDRVAAAQNVSTRTLHRLFEADGSTLGAWIRMRRLERCRADLVDGSSDEVAVSAIGSRWGLCDAAHFSRLFKSSYGLAPRAYRVVHRAHRCDERCAMRARVSA